MIANTPKPPYYAVIFTSLKTTNDDGYGQMSEAMVSLAQQQPGFLGVESARQALGITVSYWQSEQAIRDWKQQVDHLAAQKLGRSQWYAHYSVRVARVERDYTFTAEA